MCGIAGSFSKENLNKSTIKRLLIKMKRRGPDNQKFLKIKLKKKNLNLFFSRLSIIDKSPKANQPFVYKDKTLIFNGEIYNYLELRGKLKIKGYKFETSSDTEVLIKSIDCWGTKAFSKLEGMWAFFYYDKKNNTSILCRDRFGEKPLFYHQQDNTDITFGSEISYLQAILKKKLEINFDKIKNFLFFGYKILNYDNDTFFKKIKSLPPGSYMKLNSKGQKSIKSYLKNFKSSNKHNLTKIEDKLIKSINIRLRSDMPIAFTLSGGVDSNTLVNISKKKFNYDVKSFSIINRDKKYNEKKNIAITVRENNLKKKHKNIFVKKNEDIFSNLNLLTKHYFSPVLTISSLLNFKLMKKIKQSGFKVCVSGVGADELFSGYYHHHLCYLEEIKKSPNFKKKHYEWKKYILPYVRNKKLQKIFRNNKDLFEYIFQIDKFKKDIFKEKSKINFSTFKFPNIVKKSKFKNRMHLELKHEVVPIILFQDDLNAMYHSIENRSPFLDSNLYEECLKIKNLDIIENGFSKIILRKIASKFVNNKIIFDRYKKGFNTSLKDFFTSKKQKTKLSKFINENSELYKFVKKDSIIKLFKKLNKLDGNQNNFLFNFIACKMFVKKFN
jgi:asparagine synthase (glutamine-hydrolysing)